MKTHTITIAISIFALFFLNFPCARAEIIWIEHTISSGFDGGQDVCTADIDGDGDIDVLGAADLENEILWWENDGNQNFIEHIIDSNFAAAKSALPLDLDQDGDIDVLGAAGDADEVAWWENNGNESFTKHSISTTFTEARRVAAADLDGDGDIDVLATALYLNQVAWWENDGNENFEWHPVTTTFDGPMSVFACDINEDGDMDVLSAAVFGDEVAWWENDGAESFTRHTLTDQFDGTHWAIPHDLDGDGDIDVIATAAYGNQIAWWENDGSENFLMHLIADNIAGSMGLFAKDIDGDSDVDLVSSARLEDKLMWWENDGAEHFTQHVISDTCEFVGTVWADDVDQDGDVDVLADINGSDEISWWEQVGAPAAWEINLTPLGAPIIIPPQGGAFAFEASLTNNTNEPQSTSAWCTVLVPGGFQFVVAGPGNYTLDPGTSNPRLLFQFVPGNAPAGQYTYYGFLGEYPWNVIAADSFAFSKQGSNDQWLGSSGWDLIGDFFQVNQNIRSSSADQFRILGSSPNPFNPTTTIRFDLSQAEWVKLEVFDVSGRPVITLVNGWRDAGTHEVTFDGSKLASGVYIYRLQAGEYLVSGKMVLMK